MAENGRKQVAIRKIIESVPPYAVGIDIHLRDMQEVLYRQMSEEVGSIDLLWYAGGDSDILPIQMANVIAIIDKTPLLDNTNSASHTIAQAVARKHKSPRMQQLLSGSLGVQARDAITEKIAESHRQVDFTIRRTIGDGFKPTIVTDEENIAGLFSQLHVLGIDLSQVKLQKIPSGYHLSFSMDGENKHIFYFTCELPDIDDTTVSRAERERLISAFDKTVSGRIEITGRVGVMKKADEAHVADNFFLLEPDVIVFDNRNSIPLDFTQTYDNRYELHPLSGESDFGYLKAYGYSGPEEGIHPIFAFRRG